LKDWQPLLAAIIALAGGALAYRGAMAKVYSDQNKDRREFDRRKIGIYLRLSFAGEKMGERATDLVKFLTGYRGAPRADGMLCGGDHTFAYNGTWAEEGGRFRAALFAKMRVR
jgi:hypothetical protein